MSVVKQSTTVQTSISYSKPAGNRPKYREPLSEQTQTCHGSMMYDRRITRGNSCGQQVMPMSLDPAELQRSRDVRRTSMTRKKAREHYRPRTPEPLQGKRHSDIQTELYLEELSDRVASRDIDCQTDAFLDKPASPLFVPVKSGDDIETQIEDGELFDFDLEVQPLVEVLVGKTIEQSLLEVMEEEELAHMRAQQQIFLERRNAEMAETQRLEEEDRRRTEERETRIAEQMEVLKREKEMIEKMSARVYTQQYLAELVPAVFTSMRSHGFFYSPMEKDIEANFFPWLTAEVNSRLEKRYVVRQLLDTMIRNVVHKRHETFEDPKPQPAN